MKKIYLPLIAFLLTIAGCTKYDKVIKLSDVQNTKAILLEKQYSQKNICSLNVFVAGHIDGEAVITLMLNDKPYKSNKIKDNFNFKWGGDWYSDSAIIRYDPTNVKSGDIIIKYSFGNV